MSYIEEEHEPEYKTISSWILILAGVFAGLMLLSVISIVIFGVISIHMIDNHDIGSEEVSNSIVSVPKSTQTEYMTYTGKQKELIPKITDDILLAEADQFFDSYIIENSDKEILTFEDLWDYSYGELYFAYYEIFARHHVIFNESVLDSYFGAKTWYTGELTIEEFMDDNSCMLNDYEVYNKELIYEVFCILYDENAEGDAE